MAGPVTPSEIPQIQQTTPTHEANPSIESNAISWEDLELLHHFLTITALTFADRHDLQQMWRIQIPKIALKQKFLMHLIFSVTALHMASLDPKKQSSYVDKALRHHNVALPHFSSEFPTATQDNSASLFVGATLIVVSSLNLSLARFEHDASAAVDEIFGIFILLRGITLFHGKTWQWVQESEIAPLFANRELDGSIVLADDIAEALEALKSNEQLSPDGVDRSIYFDAIEGLGRCFKILATDTQDFGMILNWPILVSQEYMSLLSSRRPAALVILAHYAVVLHEVRDRWWVSEWGVKLVQEVYQMLDDEWKTMLEWPLRRILPTWSESI
ncbi:hypothetical protein IFR05_007380 [Cadophora sp. M221]|nr:hypothetical protein IFR05_007380 [Cadophora sp. M221]